MCFAVRACFFLSFFFFLKKRSRSISLTIKPVISGQREQVPSTHASPDAALRASSVASFGVNWLGKWKGWLPKLTCRRRTRHPPLFLFPSKNYEWVGSAESVVPPPVLAVTEQRVKWCSWGLLPELQFELHVDFNQAHEAKWPSGIKEIFHGWIFYSGTVTEAAAKRERPADLLLFFFCGDSEPTDCWGTPKEGKKEEDPSRSFNHCLPHCSTASGWSSTFYLPWAERSCFLGFSPPTAETIWSQSSCMP